MDISETEIKNIIKEMDERKKRMFFEKILLNSTALFQDLKIFDSKDLKRYLEEFKIPDFNSEFAFIRKNLAEFYFFDKPLESDDLKWIA